MTGPVPSVALVGNPNAGKSSLFNALTGARQKIANYPGVTVERKEGKARIAGHELTIVDLQGTYSLTAYSLQEIVARDFLIEDKPDLVMNIALPYQDLTIMEACLATRTHYLDTANYEPP